MFVMFFTACASNVHFTNNEPATLTLADSTKNLQNEFTKDSLKNEAIVDTTPKILLKNDSTILIKATTLQAPDIQNEPPKDTLADILPKDPYQQIPEIVNEIFEYSSKLYSAGFTDSASAYLEKFRVLNPLWNKWIAKADSMLNEFGKTRAEKAKIFEPLVLQIQNMNRANAAFSLVAEAADSLINAAPGDSLINFAILQKQIAYKNTLQKGKKELEQIKAFAKDHAKFAEAESLAINLQKYYRDFEDSLKIQMFIDEVQKELASIDLNAAKFWETNDANASLKKADSLMAAKDFFAAKELLNKLKFSTLRKEALEMYQKLSDIFCTQQRKITSQIFTKAKKQNNKDKKNKMLQEAILPLEKCLTEFPENSGREKILENKKFLEAEINY